MHDQGLWKYSSLSHTAKQSQLWQSYSNSFNTPNSLAHRCSFFLLWKFIFIIESYTDVPCIPYWPLLVHFLPLHQISTTLLSVSMFYANIHINSLANLFPTTHHCLQSEIHQSVPFFMFLHLFVHKFIFFRFHIIDILFFTASQWRYWNLNLGKLSKICLDALTNSGTKSRVIPFDFVWSDFIIVRG